MLLLCAWLCLSVMLRYCASYRALIFADVHIDPFYGTPNADDSRLICQNISRVSSYGTPGCCPPIKLFQSALNYAKTQESSPMFIAFLGDVVRWTASEMPDAVNNSIQIVRNVTGLTQSAFPGVPLVFVLGNHDVIPDWSTEVRTVANSQPDLMLSMYTNALASFLPTQQARDSFTYGGFYAHNISKNLTVMSINSIVLSVDHDPDTSSVADPNGMFAWMVQTLQNVRIRGAKAYMLMHNCPMTHQLDNYFLWHSSYMARYISITQTYGDVIEMHSCGHEHRDGFRTFERTLGTHGPMFVTASFMPECYSCSPTFRILDLHPTTLAVTNYTLYNAKLTSIPAQGPQWKTSYKFVSYYGLSASSNDQMRQAAQTMFTNDTLWNKYLLAYEVGDTCTDDCRRVMICNMVFRIQTSFDACVNGALEPLDASAAVPANDLCQNATPITRNAELYGSTAGATLDNLTSCTSSKQAPGVWYVLDVLPKTTNLVISLCNTDVAWDSQLSVFRGTNCSALTCVQKNDDSCSWLSAVSITTPPAGRYFIVVHGYDGAIGRFNLTVAYDLTPTPTPTATPRPTASPSPTATCSGTATPTTTPATTQTPSPSLTTTATLTASSTSSSTRCRTITPTPALARGTFTPTPTTAPTPTPTSTPTRTASLTGSGTLRRINTPSPSATTSFTPTLTAAPTARQTNTPSPSATTSFTPTPTAIPTSTPTRTSTCTISLTGSSTPRRINSHSRSATILSTLVRTPENAPVELPGDGTTPWTPPAQNDSGVASDQTGGSGDLNPGILVAAAVGPFLAVTATLVAASVLWMRRRRSSSPDPLFQSPNVSPTQPMMFHRPNTPALDALTPRYSGLPAGLHQSSLAPTPFLLWEPSTPYATHATARKH